MLDADIRQVEDGEIDRLEVDVVHHKAAGMKGPVQKVSQAPGQNQGDGGAHKGPLEFSQQQPRQQDGQHHPGHRQQQPPLPLKDAPGGPKVLVVMQAQHIGDDIYGVRGL